MMSRRVRVLGRAAETVGWAVALSLIVLIAWSGAETRMLIQESTVRSIKVAELRGAFTQLGEWLTMSARLAVATGTSRWMERHDEAIPQMKAAIAEAVGLATPEAAVALEQRSLESLSGLLAIEEAAFRMTRAGDQADAAALLNGPEYAYLEEVFKSGIVALNEDLAGLERARAERLNTRAWLEGLALGTLLLTVISSIVVKRGKARLQQARALAERAARTDPLTGLANRSKLYEELEKLNGGTGWKRVDFALLVLDLDRFRALNEAHGHQAGDELLKLVGSRLKRIARTGDLVARLDGDAFAMIAPFETGAAPGSDVETARQIADRLLVACAEPYGLSGGLVVRVGTSIGIALVRDAGCSADEIVHRADAALSRGKLDGRGRSCLFEPGIDELVRARARMEAELRRACETRELVPHFQPLVELGTRSIIAFEMLARWPRATGELVSPAVFIPIAESLGLIAGLTESLMRQAFIAASCWPPHVTLACNLSPLLLRDRHFAGMLRKLLAETGFPPSRLELEITESALVEDIALAADLMRDLKELGVSLALDDFGTGYSSLRHLQALPFDKLKIDAGFVGAMAADRDSRKIVAAVIGLGQSLGLVTVAEGVEDEDTWRTLREMGCDLGQGWLFGRPTAAGGALDVLGPEPAVGRSVIALNAHLPASRSAAVGD